MARKSPVRRPGVLADRHVALRPTAVHTISRGPSATFMIDDVEYVVYGERAADLREILAPYIAAARPTV